MQRLARAQSAAAFSGQLPPVYAAQSSVLHLRPSAPAAGTAVRVFPGWRSTDFGPPSASSGRPAHRRHGAPGTASRAAADARADADAPERAVRVKLQCSRPPEGKSDKSGTRDASSCEAFPGRLELRASRAQPAPTRRKRPESRRSSARVAAASAHAHTPTNQPISPRRATPRRPRNRHAAPQAHPDARRTFHEPRGPSETNAERARCTAYACSTLPAVLSSEKACVCLCDTRHEKRNPPARAYARPPKRARPPCERPRALHAHPRLATAAGSQLHAPTAAPVALRYMECTYALL